MADDGTPRFEAFRNWVDDRSPFDTNEAEWALARAYNCVELLSALIAEANRDLVKEFNFLISDCARGWIITAARLYSADIDALRPAIVKPAPPLSGRT